MFTERTSGKRRFFLLPPSCYCVQYHGRISRRERKDVTVYLGIDARDLTPEDVHVSVLALGAALLLAVDAQGAVALLRADAAAFHRLTAGRVR